MKLRRMYLSIHALDWFDLTPGGRTVTQHEQFPGRCELGYRNDVKLKEKVYQLMRAAKEDQGIFILPVGRRTPTRDDMDPESQALIAFAEQHFGPRCVVCRYDADWNQIRQVLGECCEPFFNGLEEDRRQAMTNRGLPERELAATYQTAPEFRAWALSKAWVFDLTRQLEERGFTFDPADAEFVVWGGDWSYCSATYSIHMARAFGLAKPMKRSFDLIDRSCGPMLLQATVVEDGLSMPDHMCLYIVKTKDDQYVAQCFEGIHGIMDHPHVVVVDFPPGSVTEVDLFGEPVERRTGIDRRPGRVVMSAGCGGHTRHKATLVRAETLSLDDFRSALRNGKVVECEW